MRGCFRWEKTLLFNLADYIPRCIKMQYLKNFDSRKTRDNAVFFWNKRIAVLLKHGIIQFSIITLVRQHRVSSRTLVTIKNTISSRSLKA